jgi:excisionase family DNA binding protein
MSLSGLTRADVLLLPPALDVETAARVLGLSLTTARDLVRRGEWPSPVLKVGRQYRIPTAPLLEVLGIAPDSSEAEPATGPALALARVPAADKPLESA